MLRTWWVTLRHVVYTFCRLYLRTKVKFPSRSCLTSTFNDGWSRSCMSPSATWVNPQAASATIRIISRLRAISLRFSFLFGDIRPFCCSTSRNELGLIARCMQDVHDVCQPGRNMLSPERREELWRRLRQAFIDDGGSESEVG